MIKTNKSFSHVPKNDVAPIPHQPLTHENNTTDTRTEFHLSDDYKNEIKKLITENISAMYIDKPIVLSEVDKKDILNKISDEFKALKESIKEDQKANLSDIIKSSEPQEAPSEFNNTELNDDEITDVLNTMLEYQDKYFSATPLNGELVQSFVWNIPKEIYKTHLYVKHRWLPDGMDPIYWFYMFCMKNPEQAIGKYIVEAINSITESDKDLEEISQAADEYDEM